MTNQHTDFQRPYVISWNLTYRCNLACEHCYLDAGLVKKVNTKNFLDRTELGTEECFIVIDKIKEFAPESVTILTGGEPLLRRDILEIIRYASSQKLWVVIGTNGVLISKQLAGQLKECGARGMALSLDSLEAERHDAFRAVKGAWNNTVKGAKILHEAGFPFIIQTTIGKHNAGEIQEIASFAYNELQAKVWNLYFLVQTGRGAYVSDISEDEYEKILGTLAQIQKDYNSKMMVNAKCAPHFVRTLFESDPESPFLKTFTSGAGGCPAGTHYMGIRPNGDVTPCPYLPVFAGNLRNESFQNIWQNSDLFNNIRLRNTLGGRCGECEFQPHCGGCRARAYGVTGDYMAEDPLCNYQPGKFKKEQVTFKSPIEYGRSIQQTIPWDSDAEERIERVPRFVRGMVIRAVEAYCVKNNLPSVSIEALAEIRSKMPTQKVF
jgi:AdoMet-dependent heme synthase